MTSHDLQRLKDLRVEPCARCGQPAKGWARINGKRYCHGDNDPEAALTCYELGELAEPYATAGGVPLGYAMDAIEHGMNAE